MMCCVDLFCITVFNFLQKKKKYTNIYTKLREVEFLPVGFL